MIELCIIESIERFQDSFTATSRSLFCLGTFHVARFKKVPGFIDIFNVLILRSS